MLLDRLLNLLGLLCEQLSAVSGAGSGWGDGTAFVTSVSGGGGGACFAEQAPSVSESAMKPNVLMHFIVIVS